MVAVPESRIERADLVAGLRAAQDELLGRAEQQKRPIVGATAAVLGGVVLLAYLIGKRAGRVRGGFIEIRR